MEGVEVMEESEEEEDDSAEERVCVNLNKDEETSYQIAVIVPATLTVTL